MSGDYKPLQDYLANVYRRLQVNEAVDGVEVVSAYHEIVGDLISKLTKSARYDNHCLYLKLMSAALRSELSFKRQGLIEKINDKLGRPVLNSIVFY